MSSWATNSLQWTDQTTTYKKQQRKPSILFSSPINHSLVPHFSLPLLYLQLITSPRDATPVKQHLGSGYLNVFKCLKVSSKISKVICKNLESFHIEKQRIIEESDEFDCNSSSFDLYQGHIDEATKDLKMETAIRILKTQYTFEKDFRSTSMWFTK